MIEMCNRKLDTLDPAALRIQALIDLARPLTEWLTDFNTILQEKVPAWERDTEAKVYNLLVVDKVMYAGILGQFASAILLALYYILGTVPPLGLPFCWFSSAASVNDTGATIHLVANVNWRATEAPGGCQRDSDVQY